MERNSLLYWYPKLKDLGIPTPKTEIVELKNQHSELIPICDGDMSPLEPNWKEILQKARKIGFPLFMRTDEFSGKHNWKKTCYVEKEENLKQNIYHLIEDSFCADVVGLPIRAIVLREFIPMKTLFTAFYGDMPVNPEIRFFIKDGEVLCWHWYWIEDAIEKGTPKDKLPFDWRYRLEDAKKKYLTGNDLLWLTNDVRKIAKKFDGYWSVDFCMSKDNRWILIDMAEGHKSWHPNCRFKEVKGNSSQS